MNINIDELLPVPELFQAEYIKKVDEGMSLLKRSRVSIISLVRNIGDILDKNIDQIYSFFSLNSKQLHYIFLENDSIDNTKTILHTYQKLYSNDIHIISEDFNREHFGSIKSEDRVKALAEYRNKAKLYASQFQSDFVIVLDMDFHSISLLGLLNSFGWLSKFDAISAVTGNSFQYKQGVVQDPDEYSLWNYDSWAFRHTWWHDLQNTPPAPSNKYDPMLWFGLWIPPAGSAPISVNSAFGGCGIYRKKYYFLADYDYRDCEHVGFHYNITTTDPSFKLVLNPSQSMLFLS